VSLFVRDNQFFRDSFSDFFRSISKEDVISRETLAGLVEAVVGGGRKGRNSEEVPKRSQGFGRRDRKVSGISRKS
jgi:hypothetical protein